MSAAATLPLFPDHAAPSRPTRPPRRLAPVPTSREPLPPLVPGRPLTQQQLLNRGWSSESIRRYLGKPDGYRRLRGGGVAALYHLRRVIAVEGRPGFQCEREVELARRASGL